MFGLTPYGRRNNKMYYNPFRGMDELEERVFGNPMSFFESGMDEFKTDIKDEGDHYELEADLPGFKKKDINIDVNDNILTINAQRHSQHEEKDKKGKYVRCERSYGAYSRQFDLRDVEADKIKAKYEDGVLKLILPKVQAIQGNDTQIEIE